MAVPSIPGRTTYWMGEAVRVLVARGLFYHLTMAQIHQLVYLIEHHAEQAFIYSRRSVFLVTYADVMWVMEQQGYPTPIGVQ